MDTTINSTAISSTAISITNSAPEWAMDIETLGKLITSIKSRGKNLDRDVHKAAVAALEQAQRGNGTWMAKLATALPGMAKARDLSSWCAAHTKGNFKLKLDGKTGIAKPAYAKKWDADNFDLALANGTPFWLFKPERKVNGPLSYDDFVDRIRKVATGDDTKVTAQARQAAELVMTFLGRLEAQSSKAN